MRDGILYFASEYNYRDNRLEIRAIMDKTDTRPVDLLKINLNITIYTAKTQKQVVEKMQNIWNSASSDGISTKTREWNSTANKILCKLRSKISDSELAEYLTC